MTKTVAFINYKGGVGKTTTAFHIGCALARDHGKKVLMIDVDPQTNLTFLCTGFQEWQNFRKTKGTLASLYRAFLNGDQKYDIRNIIFHSAGGISKLDIIPADIELLDIELDLVYKLRSTENYKMRDKGDFLVRTILNRALAKIKANQTYDYILIDCPPNLHLITQNALFTSEYYVVTAIPDHLSTIGLNILYRRVDLLKKQMKDYTLIFGEKAEGPVISGIIFVKVRTIVKLHTDYMKQLKEGDLGFLCFDNYTTEAIGYGEASAEGVPVFNARNPNARRIARQYLSITNEFIQKLI